MGQLARQGAHGLASQVQGTGCAVQGHCGLRTGHSKGHLDMWPRAGVLPEHAGIRGGDKTSVWRARQVPRQELWLEQEGVWPHDALCGDCVAVEMGCQGRKQTRRA